MSTVYKSVTLQSVDEYIAVRVGPGDTYQIRGVAQPLTTYTSSKHANPEGYYYIDSLGGWVSSKYLTISKITARSPITTTKITDVSGRELTPPSSNNKKVNTLSADEDLESYAGYVNSGSDSTGSSLMASNMNDVLGMPYQFPGHIDRKIGDSVFGRKYTERIVSNMPLLLLTPGKCVFMSDAKKSERRTTLEDLVADAFNSDSTFTSMMESYITKPTKYYTFEFDPEYYEYVNTIMQSTAVLMGIGDVKVTIGNKKNKKLKYFDWSDVTNPLTGSFGQSPLSYICLYVDAITTKNESFSNSTMDSQLASKINSFSDTAKEIQFLIGDKSAQMVNDVASSTLVQEAQSTIDSIVDSVLGGNAIFDDLANQFANVAVGGKILFPKIYQDSSFDQSFDFDLKLRCPNPTPLNWYLDIMRPLAYIYALVLPRATDGNNGYKTPFIVRGFYKNICNIDMGIVSSVSVTKGKEGSFTPEGYPTEVDVTISIEDLYNVLFMSKMSTLKNCKGLITNDQYMSFLANQVGVNINQTDLDRTVQMYKMIVTNNFIQKPSYWKNNIVSYFNNKILKMYKGVMKV